jgi:hypothetical protein
MDHIENKRDIVTKKVASFAGVFRYLLYSHKFLLSQMKTAVLEFHRNRVKRQHSGAASPEIMKTIGQLRSALCGIGKAIEAVERLAIAQAAGAKSPRRRSSLKRSKGKGNILVVMLPHPAQPADPASPGDLAFRQ